MGPVINILLDVLIIAVATTGAVTDVWKRTIPDWLAYPALGLGLVLHTVGFGFGNIFGMGLLSSLFGAAFCLVIFGLFWLWKRGPWAGDVKLMTALGALAGFVHGMTIFMASALLGAVMALGRILFGPEIRAWISRKRGAGESGEAEAEAGSRRRPMTIRFGVAAALGAVWATLIKYNLMPGF